MNTSRRVWLFRGLVIVAAGLLLLSWFMPWWSCDFAELTIKDAIIIHPWALDVNMGSYATYVYGYGDMPGFFTPVMWTYLGLAVGALLIGAWIKDKNISLFRRKLNLSRWLIGIAGFSYIVVAILAVIVAAIRTGEVGGLHLLGTTWISLGALEQGTVTARLLLGYWLACGVGLLLIVLALFRSRIIGKTKPD